MKVELANYTRNPIETCGKAAGLCWDKEEKEDYGSFLRRIIKIGHESVIEHASFTFRVEGVSRALTHQLVRHRIASYSQRSQRFVDEGEFECVIPPLEYIESKVDRNCCRDLIIRCINDTKFLYRALRRMGVKGEDARFVLPNAVCSKIYITMNARSLRNFFKLRLDNHAQWEIRKMAAKMLALVYDVAPEMFEDFV